MTLALVWLIGAIPSLAGRELPCPVAWSPDGHWLAAVSATGPSDSELPPDWLYMPARLQGRNPARRDPPGAPPLHQFRLHVSAVGETDSVLLEQTDRPLSAPSWRPDGRALVYLLTDGAGNLQTVLREGLSNRRVLATLPPEGAGIDPSLLAASPPSWSADGRHLAIPRNAPTGFTILRADTGRVVKQLDDGVWPVWASDGGRLAYLRTSETTTIQVLEPGLGPSRQVAEIGQAYQAPVWSRDGRSILAVCRRDTRRGFGASRAVELVRFHVETGAQDTIATLGVEPTGPSAPAFHASFAIGRDGEDLYYTAERSGGANVIVSFRPRTGETQNRFHPVDYGLSVHSLGLAPGGRTLAFRLGSAGPEGPLALWDVTTGVLTPVTPDALARTGWTSILVQLGRELLARALPPAFINGKPVDRATIVPVPGEITPSQEIAFRLRRVGRIGGPLCGTADSDAPADSPSNPTQLGARLFFELLREDYRDALGTLEAVERRTTSPDHRARLLGLRSQVYLGLGEYERARDVVDYLREEEAKTPMRYEVTPAGITLTPVSAGARGWSNYLAQRIDQREKALASRGDADPDGFGHRNPDNPNDRGSIPFDRTSGLGGFPRGGPEPIILNDPAPQIPMPRGRVGPVFGPGAER